MHHCGRDDIYVAFVRGGGKSQRRAYLYPQAPSRPRRTLERSLVEEIGARPADFSGRKERAVKCVQSVLVQTKTIRRIHTLTVTTRTVLYLYCTVPGTEDPTFRIVFTVRPATLML